MQPCTQEARIVKLESDVQHIDKEVGKISTKLDSFETKVVWGIIGLFGTGLVTLLSSILPLLLKK